MKRLNLIIGILIILCNYNYAQNNDMYSEKKDTIQKYNCLDTIIINGKSSNMPEDVTGKPVIYLYPKTEKEISLKIIYDGTIHTTYPLYKNGWKVIAKPNGEIKNIDDGLIYSYLFWDGKTIYDENHTTYEKGFVISRDTALIFLQKTLRKIGLNPTEYNEFIVFWLPYIIENELTFIYFRVGNEYNVISKNDVNPIPDTEIRVFIELKKVDSFFDIEPQKFNPTLRKGFTLVEWGGTELKNQITVKELNGIYIKR